MKTIVMVCISLFSAFVMAAPKMQGKTQKDLKQVLEEGRLGMPMAPAAGEDEELRLDVDEIITSSDEAAHQEMEKQSHLRSADGDDELDWNEEE